MTNNDVVNIYRLLAGAHFSEVESQEDRYKLIDIFILFEKKNADILKAYETARKTIKVQKDIDDYMNKLGDEEYQGDIPTISKKSAYELMDSNRAYLSIGNFSILTKIIKD